jgi:hypothetical protein
MITAGEMLVRTYLIAGHTLERLDDKPRYQDLIETEMDTGGLELRVAGVKGKFSKQGAKKFEDSLKAASVDYNAARDEFVSKSSKVAGLLQKIEMIAEGPKNEYSHNDALEALKEIRGEGYPIKTTIDIPSVYEANQTLKAEADMMASAFPAAKIVSRYISDVAYGLPLRTFGSMWRLPFFNNGKETSVRDYFFVHNLLKGQGWNFMHKESGMLLIQGGEYEKALPELEKAKSLGYDSLHVNLCIGLAHKQLGHYDIARAKLLEFDAIYPGDKLATKALEQLGYQR